MKLPLLLSAALLTAISAVPAVAQNQCMKSGGGPYTLEGQLGTGRFKDAAGRSETALILTLAKPVCMTGDEEEDRVKCSNKVHVFSGDENVHKRLQGLTGKQITVSGEPFGAHTAHHHAPIVFNATNVDTR